MNYQYPVQINKINALILFRALIILQMQPTDTLISGPAH